VIKPYYQDDYVTLFLGSCLEVCDWQLADVLITDPPYGMAYVSSKTKRDRPIAGDETTEVRDQMLSMWGSEKPAAVFGTWKAPRPVSITNRLIWDKSDGTGPGMGDLNQCFGHSDEEIYLFGKWPKKDKRYGSVIRTSVGISGLATSIGHPTPKPLDVMQFLIAQAPDGVIADPFSGSGSTLVAAKALNRKAIGVELEERYCEIAAKRCSQETLAL
jgi:site-specific DNA-methyltransferase (adenine-specific)